MARSRMRIFKLTWSREQDHGSNILISSYVSKRIEKVRYYLHRDKAESKVVEINEAAKELGEIYSTVITEVEVIE